MNCPLYKWKRKTYRVFPFFYIQNTFPLSLNLSCVLYIPTVNSVPHIFSILFSHCVARVYIHSHTISSKCTKYIRSNVVLIYRQRFIYIQQNATTSCMQCSSLCIHRILLVGWISQFFSVLFVIYVNGNWVSRFRTLERVGRVFDLFRIKIIFYSEVLNCIFRVMFWITRLKRFTCWLFQKKINLKKINFCFYILSKTVDVILFR